MPLATETGEAANNARLPDHECVINCQRLELNELKSSRKTRLKLPLLLLDEDFTEEEIFDEELRDEDLRDEELRDEELSNEELRDEEFKEDELRSIDEEDELRGANDEAATLVLVPVAVKLAIEGVPEPFAQNPKFTALFAAIVLFQASGVTTPADKLPFHRLLICVPAVFKVIVQLVTGALPALISTCAQ